MKPWIVSLVIFLAVFVGSIATILNPPRVVIRDTYSEVKYTDFVVMADTWRENPNYFTTVGIMGVLSLVGAGWSVHNMNLITKREHEEKTA